MDIDVKTDRSAAKPARGEMTAGHINSGAVPPGLVAPTHLYGEYGLLNQQHPMSVPMMPYGGPYPAMHPPPPGPPPKGGPPFAPQIGVGFSPSWSPSALPPPTAVSSTGVMSGPSYPTGYGSGNPQAMYVPVPYGYPPHVAAPGIGGGASFSGPSLHGAASPYGPATVPPPTASHSNIIESAKLSTQSLGTPSTAGAAAAPAQSSVTQAMTPIELVVMPLMPNVKLPPGDPFSPVGVTVPSQYATPPVSTGSSGTTADAAIPSRPPRSRASNGPSMSASQSSAVHSAQPAATTG